MGQQFQQQGQQLMNQGQQLSQQFAGKLTRQRNVYSRGFMFIFYKRKDFTYHSEVDHLFHVRYFLCDLC